METSNKLVRKISVISKTGNYEIIIRLDDECKNGHEGFSITATFWKGIQRIDRNFIMGGCCHEEILSRHPELQIFVDLHLCDFKGAPMYAVANGYYHLSRMSKDEFIVYFNITPKLYDILKTATDKQHFSNLISDSKIPEIWQLKANEGIKILEEMTGINLITTFEITNNN